MLRMLPECHVHVFERMYARSVVAAKICNSQWIPWMGISPHAKDRSDKKIFLRSRLCLDPLRAWSCHHHIIRQACWQGHQ